MNYTIDAQGKSIGRVASEAAKALMGKFSPTYERNIAPNVKVTIVNASKIDITEAKLRQTEHVTYSGYPGGIKSEKLSDLIPRRGYDEVFRRAVLGMLPKNKLQAKMIKNLIVTE